MGVWRSGVGMRVRLWEVQEVREKRRKNLEYLIGRFSCFV